MTNFWKNKKIIAYIALAHHARFITPIMEHVAALGAKTKYIIAQAERSQEITAIKSQLNYSHVFDYVEDKDIELVRANYKSSRDTFTNCLKSNFIFGSTPPTVIDKTLYATAVEYIGFKNLLTDEKPDLCLALHELHRWGKILGFWAKKFNIPFVTFQEGLYSGLDFGYTGHVQYSTLNLVWGQQIKKKLTDFEAPGDKIIPVGNTHLSDEINHQEKNKIRNKKRKFYRCDKFFTILLLFSGELPAPETLFPVFESISKAKDTCLFIKFHPITTYTQRTQWASSIPKACQERVNIVLKDENTYDLISLSDLCVITQPSTTGLEALAFGKPLIHLDIKMNQKLPYSFVAFKVALKMTPVEFAQALSQHTDFNQFIKQGDVKPYLKNELQDLKGATRRVVEMSKNLISANQNKRFKPIENKKTASLDWSIIFPISTDAQILLEQLEYIAVNSDGQGTFEVLLIEPPQLTDEIVKILGTLKGNITRLTSRDESTLPQMLNKAADVSNGHNLIFMDNGLIPPPNWLYVLKGKRKRYGKKTLLGSMVIDQRRNIIHAGMAVDDNGAPVPVYRNLGYDFPGAVKERPFKMLDHFICAQRDYFCEIGGFGEEAGKFAFMDICLRADNTNGGNDECCIYIPQVCMIDPVHKKKSFNARDSIHFFGKWHGVLWENQEEIYSRDKFSKEQLDTAQLTQSMAVSDMME